MYQGNQENLVKIKVQTKDHRGNNCAVADEYGGAVQQMQYYPYGMPFAINEDEIQPYKYNGKELDQMNGLNLYDYSARHYDPVIGSFTTVDPLAEKTYAWSPYAYCYGNPINRIDPDGRIAPLVIPLVIYGVEALIASYVAYASYKDYQNKRNTPIMDDYVVEPVTATAQSPATTTTKPAEPPSQQTDNATATTREQKKEQERNENKARQGGAKDVANHKESVNKNIGQPTSTGDNMPKRDPRDNKNAKTIGIVGGTATAGVRIGMELTNPDPSKDANDAHVDRAKKASNPQPTPLQPEQIEQPPFKPMWQSY
ncbi:hypothetical protein FACS1894180_8510 [Bacteroidia bacterium]|nr:hypothetical protein FACS1894180_8510 [Bacteroidia bacterium]